MMSPTMIGERSGCVTGLNALPLTENVVPPATAAKPGLNHIAVPTGGGIVGSGGTTALHAFALPTLVENLKALKTSTTLSAFTSCPRSPLSGVSAAAVMAATSSRCGYSIASAGTIEP